VTTLQPSEVQRLLAVANTASTNDPKGKAYEALAQYVFECVPEVVVERNQTSPLLSQQIDLVVCHWGSMAPLATVFFVECKFWEHPVDSAAVGYFITTCEQRMRFPAVGIILSPHGVTGDPTKATAAHSLAFGASVKGVTLIVLTTDDLLGLTSAADLVDLLRHLYTKAVATGGIGRS